MGGYLRHLAQQSWVLDRRKRAEIAERRVRTGARPARICEVISMDARVEGRFDVVFRLRDVPGPDEYDDWAIELTSLLRVAGARGWWEVRPNGTVSVEFPETDGAAPVATLAAALTDTDVALARARDEREAERSAFEERTLEYRRELAERSVPTWFRSVEIRGALFSGPVREGLLLVVDESVATLVAPTVPTDGTRSPNPDRIHDLLRRHDFVEEVYSHAGFGNIQMRPVPTIDHMVDMLWEADLAMEDWLAWRREHDAERAAIVEGVRAQITAAVDRASGDTP